MFDSTESMFAEFERDRDKVVAKTVTRYDVSAEYVQRYIDHLYQNHRENLRAFAYFEAEMSLYKKTLDYLTLIRKSFSIEFRGLDVLDVGCGSGYSLRAFAEFGAKSIFGLEIDQGRCESCKYVCQTHGVNAEVVHGSILDPEIVLKLGKNFDLIICFDVLEHLPSIEKAVESFTLLLKPGGYVLSTMGNRYFPEMMLHEPHYHLPGMTLLSRSTAEIYYNALFAGIYDVYDWKTRRELEAVFQDYGIEVRSGDVPPRPGILKEVKSAIKRLRQASYPNEEIRLQVMHALDDVESLTKTVENPDDFFGTAVLTIFGRLTCE